MSSERIPLDQYPYAGWIPTANGRLSFRHIGEARHPTEAIYANVATDRSRLILAYQRRPLSDVLFQTIIHYLCDISGDFWFVIAAKSDEEPSAAVEMKGFIAIYKSRDDWRTYEASVRDTIRSINVGRFSLSEDRDEIIERSFTNVQAAVNATADIRIAFHLFRSGEVFFSGPAFRDPELDYASENYAAEYGHDFPKWVADQAYFFLRDISHTHQHHAPSSDTILMLQSRDSQDVNWRRRVIFSLYHQVIRSKRFGDAPSAYQALGIQAYCMSFKSICASSPAWKPENFPTFNDAALTQSLEARAQEELARYAENSGNATIRLARAANWRTFALALVAIIIASLAILIQPRINSNESDKFPVLNAWSDFAAEHFTTVFATCLLGLGLVWMLTHSGWAIRLTFARDLLEISNIRRRRFVVIYFASALAAALVTFWAAKLAIRDIADAAMDFLRLVY